MLKIKEELHILLKTIISERLLRLLPSCQSLPYSLFFT